jgi:hypothetical protein
LMSHKRLRHWSMEPRGRAPPSTVATPLGRCRLRE